MTTTKKLNALKINKLTEAQLAAATVNEDELYLVTDAENPVTVKTDSTLNGNGSAEKPLSVSRYISAEVISAKKDGGNPNHLFFETLDNTTTWHMYQYNFESSYVGVGNTKGQIGRVGATLDAVYAAKLCKDSTELSVREGKTGDIAITSELPEAKTGTAGQVYTKTETGAEWKDAGGDYLPLSGGTMTGNLTVRNTSPSFTLSHSVYGAGASSSLGGTAAHPNWSFSFQGGGFNIDYAQDTKLSFYPDGNNYINLGKPTNKWKAIYGSIINNGADIAVPTTSGTMALVEDIDAAVGNISTALTAILGE